MLRHYVAPCIENRQSGDDRSVNLLMGAPSPR
jgi:hypothetical protein